MTRAFFLDRDGTINKDYGYIFKREQWEFLPGAVDAIKLINESDYLAIVVTNQSGIARGMYTDKDMHKLHLHVSALLAAQDARIDGYYYCPHLSGCDCRKPKPGMYRQAISDFKIDPSQSVLVGDKPSDIHAARELGCVKTALLQSEHTAGMTTVFPSLIGAVKYWLNKT